MLEELYQLSLDFFNRSTMGDLLTRINTDIGQALTVDLFSDDTSEAIVPDDVEILANETSATFDITGVDDALFGHGFCYPRLGFSSGSDQLNDLD